MSKDGKLCGLLSENGGGDVGARTDSTVTTEPQHSACGTEPAEGTPRRHTSAAAFVVQSNIRWYHSSGVRPLPTSLSRPVCAAWLNRVSAEAQSQRRPAWKSSGSDGIRRAETEDGADRSPLESDRPRRSFGWMLRSARASCVIRAPFPSRLSTGGRPGGSWSGRRLRELLFLCSAAVARPSSCPAGHRATRSGRTNDESPRQRLVDTRRLSCL